jgi:hypothetical protein
MEIEAILCSTCEDIESGEAAAGTLAIAVLQISGGEAFWVKELVQFIQETGSEVQFMQYKPLYICSDVY